MTQLTEEQALRECIALWTFLAENPEFDSKGLAIAAMGPDYDHLLDYNSKCPCCQYARHQDRKNLLGTLFCRHCPVDSWRETVLSALVWHPCLEDTATYGGWMDAQDSQTRAEKARALVELAQSSLDSLLK